jgi:predicted Zn-dependent protease
MQGDFEAIAGPLCDAVTGDEILLLRFAGEQSDFVRLNHGKVRQAGRVEQRILTLQLVRGSRHASATIVLSGVQSADLARARESLGALREQLPLLPEDPHLLFSREPQSSEHIGADTLPRAADAIDEVVASADGLDLVGIWASGGVHEGFANSLGQRNWFTTYSFNLDWSVYHQTDKASKNGYAGTAWDSAAFAQKMDKARTELAVLQRPARTIPTGSYRVYLAPSALEEITGLLSWGGFGLKAQRSKRSPLLRAVEGKESFDPRVGLSEHTGAGLSPGFGSSGFRRPDRVTLFSEGRFAEPLISPRSSKEFGVPTNGASDREAPASLEMQAGELVRDELLATLGTGVWINNLWYLNYSDLPACRMTGMTRFTTLWVEDGEVVAPLNVMRFDDSVYRMLGSGLVGLTRERELLLSASTYGGRSTESALLPGAIIDGFRFTL